MAKRDLKAGEILDDYGMYMTYGEAVNADEMCRNRYLPEGLVEGCVLKRDVAEDGVLTYDDVTLPPGRLADQLRAEQYRVFRGETWLEELFLCETPNNSLAPKWRTPYENCSFLWRAFSGAKSAATCSLCRET